MNWRYRTMDERLDVKGKTVLHIIKWYYEGEIVINRRYQRKLVWSLDEKKLFIDSALNSFPTPSMILVSYKGENNNHYFEVIDGLQRLNAIVSFVEGEFGVEYNGVESYFDISYIPSAHTKLREGKLVQKEPMLPREFCDSFAEYEMPIVLTEQDDDKVEQIFSRINSTGRKLSAHDLRQASAVGEFPDLVRRIACRVRGDYTYSDMINLCDMPKISVGAKELNYGVLSNDTFWRRHDIITAENLKQSKDEEIIASLLGIILLKDDFTDNANDLDKLYRAETDKSKKINEKIESIGKDNLENYMSNIFSQFDIIFRAIKSNFTNVLFKNKKTGGKSECFKIIFLAFYRLFQENYKIRSDSYSKVTECLKYLGKNVLKSITDGKKIDKSDKKKLVESAYESLKKCMQKTIDKQCTEIDNELEKLFLLSKIESQMVEFKIGVSDFSSGKINGKCIKKIAKTLVAMANTSDDKGYLIIGVADNIKSCKNWESVYGKMAMKVGNHYITGITEESVRHFHGQERYYKKIGELLKKEPISDNLKDYVLKNYKLVSFKEYDLLILFSKMQETDSLYDGKKYVRYGSETKYVEQ